jgi:hypothetical protein
MEFRHALLAQVNSNIMLLRRSGVIVPGLRPLTMKDLHTHVLYSFLALCAFVCLAACGLLLPVLGYGTVFAVLFNLAQ